MKTQIGVCRYVPVTACFTGVEQCPYHYYMEPRKLPIVHCCRKANRLLDQPTEKPFPDWCPIPVLMPGREIELSEGIQ
jgi:hypothetical protein